MEIVETRRILFLCVLAMVNTMAICGPTGNHEIAMNNETTDPCNDFYGHVCGRWETENPPGESNIEFVQQIIDSQLQSLVEDWSKNNETTLNEVERKLMKYYNICLDEDYRHRIEIRFVLSEIISRFGHWPMTLPYDVWPVKDRKLSLIEVHERYAELVDSGALFTIGVELNVDPVTKKLINYPAVMIPNFGNFPDRARSYFTENELNFFRNFVNRSMYDVFDDFQSDIEDQADDVWRFSKSIRGSLLSEESTNSEPTFKMFEIQRMWDRQIPKWSPFWINWTHLIKQRFSYANVTITDDQDILIKPTLLLYKLGGLLREGSERTVVNYIHWSGMTQLTRDMVNRFEYKGPKGSEKYRRCLHDGPMNDHGMSYLWVKKYFNDFERTRTWTNEKVNGMKVVLERKISEASMDENAKIKLRDFFDNLVTNIGYPTWYDEPRKIEEYMSDLEVGDNYLVNQIQYTRFCRAKRMQAIGPVDRHGWSVKPHQLKTEYMDTDNSLTIPAAFLQKPYFDIDDPRLNSGIEFVIAHELGYAIIHNFDNVVRCPTDDKTEICTKRSCIIGQYLDSAYQTIGWNTMISGNSVHEYIGDNVGLRPAWDMYSRKQADPQGFFKSVAKIMCEGPITVIKDTRYHLPIRSRVNDMMKNMREFSTAFDCPIGSPMNPRDKCDFWSRT